MDLILIYGAPATGKSSIANELVKLKGYKFLHNHAVIDLASSSLNISHSSFWSFCWKLRFDVVKEAINQDVKVLIMSMAFSGTRNEIKSMDKIVKFVEKSGGNIKLIKLVCDFEELKNRVSSDSRKKFGKIHNTKDLKSWFENYNESDIVPDKEILILDNTKLSLSSSTKKIIEFLDK